MFLLCSVSRVSSCSCEVGSELLWSAQSTVRNAQKRSETATNVDSIQKRLQKRLILSVSVVSADVFVVQCFEGVQRQAKSTRDSNDRRLQLQRPGPRELIAAKFSFLFDKNSSFLKFCLKSCPYGLVSRKVIEGVDPWWWQTLRVATRQHTCEAHEHLTVQTLDNRSQFSKTIPYARFE